MKKQIIVTTALAALLSPSQPSRNRRIRRRRNQAQQSIPPAPPVPPALFKSPLLHLLLPRGRHLREHEEGAARTGRLFLESKPPTSPRVLSEQMGLPRGFGVVIDYVVPNSPAASAGVQASDIIRMLNDQYDLLAGSAGAKLWLRKFDDGANVTLTLLRKGKEVKVTVKLTKKDDSYGRGPFGLEWEWKWDDLGKTNFDFDMPDMTTVREAVARAKDGSNARRGRSAPGGAAPCAS